MDGSGRARLGAHVPIGGGFVRATERAVSLDATAFQVFVKSARQWASRELEPVDVRGFRRRVERLDLGRHVLAHASYLINLAAPDGPIRERSLEAAGVELERCRRLGIPYLVVHPGAHGGAGEALGIERVARALDRLLGRRSRGPTLLLEITAGQGSCLGWRFEELGAILARTRAERVGVCFDTCHAHAAGYELRTAAGYRRTFVELERAVGLERLQAFHLNDSRTGLGSRVDRHEHIGRGELGLAPFRRILNDPRFRGLPMVLETHKGPDLAEDRVNLATLRGLLPASRR